MRKLTETIYHDRIRVICFALMVLLVHAVKIFTYLPTYDSMYAMDLDWFDSVGSGRWLNAIINNIISSPYDLHYVEGILSAVFISLSIELILSIFDLNSRVETILSAMLFITFPSVAAIFCYGFWLPAYTLGLLMSALGVWILLKSDYVYKKRAILSIILFVFSLSIYQIYFFFAIALGIYFYIFIFLTGKWQPENRDSIHCYICSVILGIIGYLIVNKIVMSILHTEFGDYQGGNSFGILSLKEYALAFLNTLKSLIVFFIPIQNVTFYGILNVAIVLLICIVILTNLKRYKSAISKLLLICLPFVSIPFTYVFYFASPEMVYHGIMEIGNYYLYLLLILFIHYGLIQRLSMLKATPLIVLTLICYYNFVNTNIAYKQMEMSYSRTQSAVQEIITYIDREDNPQSSKIAIIGEFDRKEDSITAIPRINAAYTNNFLSHPYHFCQFAKYYFGRDYEECSKDEVESLSQVSSVKNMPQYPSPNCVNTIGNTIVVKLSEPK